MGGERGGPVRRLFRLGLGRPAPDEAVEWEVEHHLEELADRLVGEGWEEDEARREAERRFGNERHLPKLRRSERRRGMVRTGGRRWEFIRGVVSGTSRTVRRQPGLAVAIILTLGLGIGANAAMFGILDRLLLSPPEHVADPDAVKRIVIDRGSWSGATISYPDFMDFREHEGFAGVAVQSFAQDLTVGEGPEAVQAPALLVSHEFFPLLGAEPVLGRVFTEEEDRPGAPLTAVISHEYWREAFGGGTDVLGRSLELSGMSTTIVGVAPPGFTGVGLSRVDVWLPIETARFLQTGDAEWKEGPNARGSVWVRTVARLRDVDALRAAEEQATGLHVGARAEQIEQGRYSENARVELRPLVAARGPDASDESKVALWLGGVSLIVLLIACANVANLLLARETRRRREVAVRLALGISRGRLIGQTVLETVALGLLGGALALVLAHWGGGVVRRFLLPGVFFPASPVEGSLVLVTLTLSVGAGLLAGLGPALQSGRMEVHDDLRDAGRGNSGTRSPLRSGLMVAQAAMSVLLLAGAGLFVRSLAEVRGLDLGLDADAVVLSRLELTSELEPEEQNALYRTAVQRVEALPGVARAAAVTSPFQWAYSVSLRVPGIDTIPRMPGGGPYYYAVTPGYFETLGQQVLHGRGILPSDVEGAEQVAVVNRSMADSLWGGRDGALGGCLMVGRGADVCTTVVGVVEDASRGSLQGDPYFGYYLAADQAGLALRGLYIRAADGDGDALKADLASLLRSFSPRVRYATAETLREILDPQARSWTLGASMFTIFGLLALVVSAVGLYGVLAFDVAQRTREIGIRSALGAARGRLLGSVLGEGLRLAGLGLVLGLVLAWLAAPRIQDLLFEVPPRAPDVLTGVAAVLLGVATMAALLPGLKATRVDPSEALRSE